MARTHQPSYSSDHNHHQRRQSSRSSAILNDPVPSQYPTPSPPLPSLHTTRHSLSRSTLNSQATEDFTLVAVDPQQNRTELTTRPTRLRLSEIPDPDTLPRPDTLSPTSAMDRPRSTRQSSKRALTEALRLAQEAVLLDSQNDDPIAAFRAYSRSVTLLGEVMERVIRGDQDGDLRRRSNRVQNEMAREEEARRLRNIVSSLVWSEPR